MNDSAVHEKCKLLIRASDSLGKLPALTCKMDSVNGKKWILGFGIFKVDGLRKL